MKTKKNTTKIAQLKTWLFNKPVLFALSFFVLSAVFSVIYAGFQTVFNTNSLLPMYLMFFVSFVACIYYVIKKLPHESLNQNDFVAITNGTSIISILTSLFGILGVGIYGPNLKHDLMGLYLFHPVLFIAFSVLLSLFVLYLIGLAICGIYAKYKRATTIGISPWKVILSMPFGFLLMWTPGYLINGKNVKTSLDIKSNWYNRFNKWVMDNSYNLIFVFLFFLFCKGIIAGISTVILYFALLIIYALWYAKHKSDFMQNINRGYALTAVIINIAILLAFIYGIFTSTGYSVQL